VHNIPGIDIQPLYMYVESIIEFVSHSETSCTHALRDGLIKVALNNATWTITC